MPRMMGIFDRFRVIPITALITAKDKISSDQPPDSTDFCEDCQRSVDLDDRNFVNHSADYSFTEESHYERRDTMPDLKSLLSSAGLASILRSIFLFLLR